MPDQNETMSPYGLMAALRTDEADEGKTHLLSGARGHVGEQITQPVGTLAAVIEREKQLSAAREEEKELATALAPDDGEGSSIVTRFTGELVDELGDWWRSLPWYLKPFHWWHYVDRRALEQDFGPLQVWGRSLYSSELRSGIDPMPIIAIIIVVVAAVLVACGLYAK